MYTKTDARREVDEMLRDNESLQYIKIFLNDLSRSKDITWDDNKELMFHAIDYKIKNSGDAPIFTFDERK